MAEVVGVKGESQRLRIRGCSSLLGQECVHGQTDAQGSHDRSYAACILCDYCLLSVSVLSAALCEIASLSLRGT